MLVVDNIRATGVVICSFMTGTGSLRRIGILTGSPSDCGGGSSPG